MAKTVVEGILIGVLAAVAILYGFQTRIAYPTFVVNMLNHPWVLLLLFVAVPIVAKFSAVVGALMFLLLVAFAIDALLFARPLPTLLKESPSEQMSHASAMKALPNDAVLTSSVSEDVHGVPLNAISLPMPVYPTFNMDPHEARGGPAPFP
jgi:hypothetical protein